MSPPTGRRRLGREAASKSSSVMGGGHDYLTRFIPVDPVTVRSLALVVPCGLCVDGLCLRCIVVARAVEQLTIAARVEQSVDDTWGVAA